MKHRVPILHPVLFVILLLMVMLSLPCTGMAQSVITLSPGWNFFSFPKEPPDQRIEAVLAGISSHVAIVWGYDNTRRKWTRWKPGDASSSLFTMESGKGYWLYMSDAAGIIDMTSWSSPASTAVGLRKGWNLVGYSGTDNLAFSNALNGIQRKWQTIWTWDQGERYGKDATTTNLPPPGRSLARFEKGKAYWVKMRQASATWEQPTTPLAVPPPAKVIADGASGRVQLSWSPVPAAVTYNLYYASSPGVTKVKGTKISGRQSPYTLRGLTDNTPLYFIVTTVDSLGDGVPSQEVSATPSPKAPPFAPTYVTAAAEPGQARINWRSSDGATSYSVYHSKAPHITKTTGTRVANATSPTVVGSLADNTTYYFVVTASNANGESATSFEVSATPSADPPPGPPLNVTSQESNGRATVSWEAAPGAASYNIYYAGNRLQSKKSGIKIANVTSPLAILGLTNKRPYFFVVTAANSTGESVESAQVSATPLAAKPVHTMVMIPAGAFQMGDNLDRTAYCLPVHEVALDTFYIEPYETTYDLWKEVYDWALTHGYAFDNPGRNGTYHMGTNMPATEISWYDVLKWLNARSEKDGRTPVYYTDAAKSTLYRTGRIDLRNDWVKWDANGYRLPTEAEWEKAVRGGLTGLRYPWGNDIGKGNSNDSLGQAMSVGTYPPNNFGLYDMAGNVFEWVWDWGSTDDAYKWASDPIANPRGPEADQLITKGTRVRRGGSYAYGSRFHRSYERMFRVPTYSALYSGFRSVSNQR